jgi:hypothetical protein
MVKMRKGEKLFKFLESKSEEWSNNNNDVLSYMSPSSIYGKELSHALDYLNDMSDEEFDEIISSGNDSND